MTVARPMLPQPRETSPVRALTYFSSLPKDCATFLVDDGASAPHLKIGEFAVVDTADNEPQKGEIYLIQYDSGPRNRRIVQVSCSTHTVRVRGRSAPRLCWWVRDLAGWRRTDNMGGIPVFSGMSDGPYLVDHLKSKLLGRVVGYAVTSLGALLAPSAEPEPHGGRTNVTAVRKPPEGRSVWSGTASDARSNYEWIYEPRKRFTMRRQDPASPNLWLYCRAPADVRRAVAKAVGAAANSREV